MNPQSPGPHDSNPTGPDTAAGTAPATGGAGSATPAKYQAVLGPFTIRDLTIFGSTLLMFIASLLPMFGGRYNLWNLGNLFFLLLGIILPLVVVALFVARRLQPGTIVRVGSLSIDQFASVTASFALPLFFLTITDSFNGSVLLGLVGSLGLLAATVLAPHLPWLSADFKDRAEAPAHVVAREAAVPSRKPAAPKAPKAPKEAKAPSAAGFGSSNAGFGTGTSSPYTPPVTPAASATSATQPPTSGAPVVGEARDSRPAVDVQPSAEPVASAAPAAAGTPAATAAEAAPEPSPAEPDVAFGGPAKPAAPEAATTQHTTQPPAAQQTADNEPAAHQPSAEQPASQRPWAATMATPIVSGDTRVVSDSIGATVDPASRPDESSHTPAYEAFWFAVAQPRTVYNEQTGSPVFTIEPGGWVLALEDRGHEFLVQDTDGKVGVLRELSNIERG
ncbi:hypothetical protein ACIQC5_00175 [Paenarthrobacter sp. NPDC092416]|uniref:hypothetical protein n=1 Tax=Paenarthrobacter sp. NPDC092416 TaxID=3364386 RepID=UPI003812598A